MEQYDLRPLPRWSLEHRLFRATQNGPSTIGLSAEEVARSQSARYLQVLSISYQAPQSYVAITTTLPTSQTRAGTPATTSSGGESAGEPANIISIPSGAQSENFIQLVLSRFGPLWTQRQSLSVSNGQAFEVEDFRIRLGEVRQGQGGAQQNRGVIVEVEWAGGDDDWDAIEDEIRAFWTGLDFKGAREYIRVPGIEKNLGNIRQWCEAIRLRT